MLDMLYRKTLGTPLVSVHHEIQGVEKSKDNQTRAAYNECTLHQDNVEAQKPGQGSSIDAELDM